MSCPNGGRQVGQRGRNRGVVDAAAFFGFSGRRLAAPKAIDQIKSGVDGRWQQSLGHSPFRHANEHADLAIDVAAGPAGLDHALANYL